MNEKGRRLIIDMLLGVITLSTCAVIFSYFVVAPKISHTTALVPSQAFLFTTHYFLNVILIAYSIVFVIKIIVFIFNKEFVYKFGTPLVFDFIVILIGILFPRMLLI